MKISQKKANIIISNQPKKKENFKINSNAQAFSILSDKLYTNKILAVVREYICNAYDAHIDNNTASTPPEIHLPNKLEPFFSIRDFGRGLSEEDVEKYYCTYFASNKNDSEELIGGFGIGCKAAFAYTDTFNITSWFNGYMYHYALNFMGSTPEMVLTHKKKSNEPTGIKVFLGVKESDIEDFKDATVNILSFFPDKFKPEDTPNAIYYGNNDKILLNTNLHFTSSNGTTLSVILNNIKYPCISEYTEYHKYFNILAKNITISSSLFNKFNLQFAEILRCYTLRIPDNSMALPPSRENIIFNDEAKKIYEQELEKAITTIYNDFENILRNSSNIREYINTCRKKYRFLRKDFNFLTRHIIEEFAHRHSSYRLREDSLNHLKRVVKNVLIFQIIHKSYSLDTNKVSGYNLNKSHFYYTDDSQGLTGIIEYIHKLSKEEIILIKSSSNIGIGKFRKYFRQAAEDNVKLPNVLEINHSSTHVLKVLKILLKYFKIPFYESFEEVCNKKFSKHLTLVQKKRAKKTTIKSFAKSYDVAFVGIDPKDRNSLKVIYRSFTLVDLRKYIEKNKTTILNYPHFSYYQFEKRIEGFPRNILNTKKEYIIYHPEISAYLVKTLEKYKIISIATLLERYYTKFTDNDLIFSLIFNSCFINTRDLQKFSDTLSSKGSLSKIIPKINTIFKTSIYINTDIRLKHYIKKANVLEYIYINTHRIKEDPTMKLADNLIKNLYQLPYINEIVDLLAIYSKEYTRNIVSSDNVNLSLSDLSNYAFITKVYGGMAYMLRDNPDNLILTKFINSIK